MKKLKKLFENGRTMLEVLAVLAILATIGVGIFAGINHGLMVYRASVLQTQMPQIKKAIETVYAFNNYDYSDIETRADYQELFGNILGENACTGNMCQTPGGRFMIKSIKGGTGFKIVFVEMPKGICAELADAIKSERKNILATGFIMGNSCNDDKKQRVEFANIVGYVEDECPGNQIWDGEKCSCLNDKAIGEDCVLPNTDPAPTETNPNTETTTTTTQPDEIHYSSEEETEQAETTVTHQIHYSNTNAIEEGITTQVHQTQTETTTRAAATTTPVKEQTTAMDLQSTIDITSPVQTSDAFTTIDLQDVISTDLDNGYNGNGGANVSTIIDPSITGLTVTTTATATPTTTATPTVTRTATTTPYATDSYSMDETDTYGIYETVVPGTTTATATRAPETTTTRKTR